MFLGIRHVIDRNKLKGLPSAMDAGDVDDRRGVRGLERIVGGKQLVIVQPGSMLEGMSRCRADWLFCRAQVCQRQRYLLAGGVAFGM